VTRQQSRSTGITHHPQEVIPMAAVDNDTLVRDFVEAFNTKDADRLAPFLHEDIVFSNYGDGEVRGRDQVVQVWKGVFSNFEQVRFETVHQAVDRDVVIAEQIHGLALPCGPLAPIMNMAVYEISDGTIAAWRDYTNPGHARTLLRG
jgi:limonene-1,2-epoxide hydrolase